MCYLLEHTVYTCPVLSLVDHQKESKQLYHKSSLFNQAFVSQLLQKSQRLLLQNRLLAEHLLTQAGISYHQEGYVTIHVGLRLNLVL
jgi:hypothetical protein